MKKSIKVFVFVGFFGLCSAAYAWVWIPTLVDGAISLGSLIAANYRVWKIGEVVTSVVAGAMITDVWLNEKTDANSSPTNSGTTGAAVNIMLKPNASRQNPDPKTWDDAVDGKVDPTPKPAVVPVVDKSAALSSSPSKVIVTSSGWEVVPSVTYKHSVIDTDYDYRDISGAKLTRNAIQQDFSYSSFSTPAVEVSGVKIPTDISMKNKSWLSADKQTKFTWNNVDARIGGNSYSVSDQFESQIKTISVPRSETGKAEMDGLKVIKCLSKYRDWQPEYKTEPWSCDLQYYTVIKRASESDFSPVPNKVVSSEGVVAVSYNSDYGYTELHKVTTTQLCSTGKHFDESLNTCVDGPIKKPQTTPCQVVYSGGAWQIDANNPSCDQTTDKVAASGNIVQTQSGKERVQVEVLANGHRVVTWTDGTNWKVFDADSPGDSASGAVVGSATDSKTGYMPSIGTKFPAIGTGTGTDGSGTGGCGGTGQTPCSINDSGFSGKDSELAGKFGELGKAGDARLSDLEGFGNSIKNENHGFVSDWLPRFWGESVQCENIDLKIGFDRGPLAGVSSSAVVDFCDKAKSIKAFFSWLFYIGGVIYIWRRMMRSNSPGSSNG